MGSITIIVLKDVVEELRSTIDDLPDQFQTIIIDPLKEDSAFFLSIYTPFDEGDLVSENMVVDDGQFSFYTDNPLEYYPYVVLGTRAHWIGSPVNIKGSWVYIGEHPGTAPQDYPGMAFEDLELTVDSRLDEMGSWIVGDI
jgi:hypothetical protein